jgi:hypothetical protein
MGKEGGAILGDLDLETKTGVKRCRDRALLAIRSPFHSIEQRRKMLRNAHIDITYHIVNTQIKAASTG